MTPTELVIPAYAQMLRALSQWLDKASERPDADALMAARLAPDMFPLAMQVRFACVQALEVVDRLSAHGDQAAIDQLLAQGREGSEQPGTIADAQAAIAATLRLLDAADADVLDAGTACPVAIELPMAMAFDMTGEQYLRDWALPQFYFHLTMAYAILRAQGVPLGKADYVSYAVKYLRPGSALPV